MKRAERDACATFAFLSSSLSSLADLITLVTPSSLSHEPLV
jgi:hypothetical protein